ncbi:MAG TPA: hypothetical protein VKD28_05220 [Gemmatimonadales bacterium]|nr:hypothetical protein [Gemmatimonadales bacterium]
MLDSRPTFFSALGKQALGEIQSLLRLRKLVLERLHDALELLDPAGDLGGW